MVSQLTDLSMVLIKAEIPIVEKIIRDETWYEGERRGCCVSPEDSIVVRRVCKIIQQYDPVIRHQALGSVRNQ
jgi:hypothetical protein